MTPPILDAQWVEKTVRDDQREFLLAENRDLRRMFQESRATIGAAAECVWQLKRYAGDGVPPSLTFYIEMLYSILGRSHWGERGKETGGGATRTAQEVDDG